MTQQDGQVAEAGSGLMYNDLDPTGELAEYAAKREAEYGTYVAAQRIFVGNALAYDVGHQVPVSNVVKHGYLANGLVELAEGAEHPEECLPQVQRDAAEAAVTEPTPAQSEVSTESTAESEEN